MCKVYFHCATVSILNKAIKPYWVVYTTIAIVTTQRKRSHSKWTNSRFPAMPILYDP